MENGRNVIIDCIEAASCLTSLDLGLRAYWMLHSPTTFRCLITLSAVVLSMLYSSLLSVCEGATTIDSPVWIPRGSTFSMLHTVMQLSCASLTTSYSTSFHPHSDLSMSTCVVREKALLARLSNSSTLLAKPEPRPNVMNNDYLLLNHHRENYALKVIPTGKLYIASYGRISKRKRVNKEKITAEISFFVS